MTSIWLQPLGDQLAALQRIIDTLAQAHGTVGFAPHLTVCGVPNPSTLDAAAAYIRECGFLPLTVAKTAVTGAVITPFRAVFIEIEDSPGLRQFRERLRTITGAPALIPPHISLLYTIDRVSQTPRTDFEAGRLADIAGRCAAMIADAQFALARPIANGSGANDTDVRGWRVIREL